MRYTSAIFVSAGLLLAPLGGSRADIDTTQAPDASLELVVIEAEGCIYCQLFRRDVLPSYEASDEAKEMPVRFVDINDIDANHLDFKSSIDVVPTFVVVKSHREIGRIAGYMGPENFFHSINYVLGSGP